MNFRIGDTSRTISQRTGTCTVHFVLGPVGDRVLRAKAPGLPFPWKLPVPLRRPLNITEIDGNLSRVIGYGSSSSSCCGGGVSCRQGDVGVDVIGGG